jgi:hypothetical protein
LTSVLDAAKRVASIFASKETFFDGHVGRAKLILLPHQRSAICPFGVAAQRLVVGDDRIVDRREGGVHIDRDDISSTTCLGLISCARIDTIGFINLRAIDGGSTETLSVIL